MTNEEIISRKSKELMAHGILKIAGYIDGLNEDGELIQIPMPEEIHTFAGWKALGYIVKKGEHARASFPVWTVSNRRQAGRNGNGVGNIENDIQTVNCYRRKAYWFTRDQVEEITA